MSMQLVQVLAASSVFIAFACAELWCGRFFPREATREDDRLDIVITLTFPLTSGLVLLLANILCEFVAPAARGAFADWPWWAMLATLLIGDDLTQYLWHRLSHTSVLWPLHRAHHSAAYMSVRVVYRNNFFYYLLMPGLWISGTLLYLGFGWFYVGYAIVKLAVIIGAHSAVRWDEALYRHRTLHPLMWLLERTISTPATHYAHHALSQDDGIGHYTGNYGNLLFLWDVLFGTARITRRYPPAFGLADDRLYGNEGWAPQFLFPLLRSSRTASALSSSSEHRRP